MTPHLNDSDQVRIDVDMAISDVASAPGAGDTFGTVSYLERTATTTLTVKNGQTVVIGGLVRSRKARQEKKVPVLGDLPLIGVLFRTSHEEMQKSNLVLVLTPHIVRDEEDLRAIHERKMQERQELMDRDAMFQGQKWEAPRDLRHARGLLAHVRASQLDVDRRIAERARALDVETAAPAVPLESPVPLAPASPRPAAAAPRKGPLVEK
jgi:general secretion pathway protein D